MAGLAFRTSPPAMSDPLGVQQFPDSTQILRSHTASLPTIQRRSPEVSLPTKAARAWKLVDANKILTKRKYVKKKKAPEQKENVTESTEQVALEKTSSQPSKAESSDEQTLSPERSERSLSWPSPEADTVLTGLRGNPFASYPDDSLVVHRAFDFLVKEIGVNAVPGTVLRDGYSPKVAAFMRMALKYDSVFHALVSFARGYDEVGTNGARNASSAVLYHRGMATKLLLERLRDPSTCADDASILTTFLLVDSHWRFDETETGKQHHAGLLQMIEMRGGLDNLNLPAALRASIDFAEVTDIGDKMAGNQNVELPSLTYPMHPFSPQICGLIARLPEGYAQIAMQGQLSMETMATILSLRDWLKSDPSKRTPCPHLQIGSARKCMAASKPPDHSTIEEAVCFGIVITGMRSFHARFARMDHPFLDRIVTLGEQFDKPSTSNKKKQLSEREHVAYLTMVAVEASDKCIELQGHVKKLVDLLLARERFARTWQGMENAIARFFWVDFAADKWRQCWLKHLKRFEEEKKSTSRASFDG